MVLAAAAGARVGQLAVSVVEIVQGQADLFQVVLTSGPVSRLAHLLHSGQQQADEHGDDSNHHQQLDEGKTV